MDACAHVATRCKLGVNEFPQSEDDGRARLVFHKEDGAVTAGFVDDWQDIRRSAIFVDNRANYICV